MKRICIICREERQTTNQQTKYICEPCLRTRARELLLTKAPAWQVLLVVLISLGIGFVIAMLFCIVS